MRRLLFIAYFFPPLGGAGVQRAVKFAKFLPSFGWVPAILTARRSSYWLADESLVEELPADLDVRRVFSPDGVWLSSRLGGRGGPRGGEVRSGRRVSRLRRAASWCLVPDSYRPWKLFALREARAWLREGGADVILTTSSPDTAHLIGLDLARETGLAWVADFRDPWTRRISFEPPSGLHRRWQEALERSVLKNASSVVVTAEETRDEFLARCPELPAERFHVIPNGFDPVDFPQPPPPIDWERFTIVYAGQLTSKRTVAPLLPVLRRFFERSPRARGATRVRLIGPHELENETLVRDAGMGDVIGFEPSLPHRKAVASLYAAHVVLLVENMGPNAGLIVQGKVWECLRSGRPILALVPPGGARRVVQTYRAGCAAGSGEEERAAGFLVDAHRAWEERRVLRGADPIQLTRFERKNLTADLAAVLDRAASREPKIILGSN